MLNCKFRFLYGIPIMTDCHDHVDFKANPALTRWEENLLRLGLLRKFLRNISEKHPDTEVDTYLLYLYIIIIIP